MARNPRMVYVPLDVEFFDNDKVLEAGEKAGWLYLNMLARVKRLKVDGILSAQQIERLHVAGWQKRLDALIAARLVIPLDDGRYLVVGWLDRNPSQEELADYRRKDSSRKSSKPVPDSVRNPDGIRSESEPEEKRREEKRREPELDVTLRRVGAA